MISMKPTCNHLIVLDTIFEDELFLCRQYEKLHKKLLPPERPFLTQICTKSFVGWGFAPDPTGRAYGTLPDPLAVFRGLLLTEGREEEGRNRAEGTGGKGREERGGGDRWRPEKEGEGRAPMTLWHGAPNVLIRLWPRCDHNGHSLSAAVSVTQRGGALDFPRAVILWL